jgi:hypothetical protein
VGQYSRFAPPSLHVDAAPSPVSVPALRTLLAGDQEAAPIISCYQAAWLIRCQLSSVAARVTYPPLSVLAPRYSSLARPPQIFPLWSALYEMWPRVADHIVPKL